MVPKLPLKIIYFKFLSFLRIYQVETEVPQCLIKKYIYIFFFHKRPAFISLFVLFAWLLLLHNCTLLHMRVLMTTYLTGV